MLIFGGQYEGFRMFKYQIEDRFKFVNWIIMTRKSAEQLRTAYGNTGQPFRPY